MCPIRIYQNNKLICKPDHIQLCFSFSGDDIVSVLNCDLEVSVWPQKKFIQLFVHQIFYIHLLDRFRNCQWYTNFKWGSNMLVLSDRQDLVCCRSALKSWYQPEISTKLLHQACYSNLYWPQSQKSTSTGKHSWVVYPRPGPHLGYITERSTPGKHLTNSDIILTNTQSTHM